LTEDKDKEFVKACNCAYRLLSYRQRSSKEIAERLKRKKFSTRIIQRTLEHLSKLNYINDEDFARFWIREKIESHPVGWTLLRYQLRQKGVDEKNINKACADFSSQYDEASAARKLVKARRAQFKGLKPLKSKKRLYDYLRRRGFSSEAISTAIRTGEH